MFTALVSYLALGALVVTTPLHAQETDSIPRRAWISDSWESPPLTLPNTDAIARQPTGGPISPKTEWSEEEAAGLKAVWPNDEERSRRFITGGTIIGAVVGLVAFTAADGLRCLDDRDPVTGRRIDSTEKMNCIFQTSLPIYVGSGALGGAVLGWLVDRVTR
jgi:hypothetical protein